MFVFVFHVVYRPGAVGIAADLFAPEDVRHEILTLETRQIRRHDIIVNLSKQLLLFADRQIGLEDDRCVNGIVCEMHIHLPDPLLSVPNQIDLGGLSPNKARKFEACLHVDLPGMSSRSYRRRRHKSRTDDAKIRLSPPEILPRFVQCPSAGQDFLLETPKNRFTLNKRHFFHRERKLMHSIYARSRRTSLLLALLVPASLIAGASGKGGDLSDPKEAAHKFIITERDHSDVMTNLEYLSDMIGPRLTGSTRLKRANDWTAEKMKEYGLENVHLESYTIPRGWERGAVEMKIVENGLSVEAAQTAWTPGTHGKVTGPVILFNPRTEADLAAYKGKLKNAILLSSDTSTNPKLPDVKEITPIPAFAPDDPGTHREDKTFLGTDSPTPAQSPAGQAPSQPPPGGRRQGAGPQSLAFRKARNEFLKKEGAAVLLQDSGKPHDLLNMTGSWTSAQSIPSLFVSHEHIAMLQRMLKRGNPIHVEVNITSKFVEGPIIVYNTVGEIKGSEKPDEVVLLGAHLDSWDLGTGSTDNGTGSMAVLEAARIIKMLGVAPKRTMRFVLFTGEEEGLMGSKAYVEAHKSEMPNFDVVFIHDTGTGRVKGAWLQGRAEDRAMLAEQFDMLKSLKLLTDEPNLLPNKMNGTDHASFDDAGVPAFAFNQDPAEYSLTHHSQSDTFDKVRADDLKQGVCALAIFGYTAAQSPERYPRSTGASTP